MSNLVSLLAWTVLPNLATDWTQSLYYSLTIRAGDRKPQPGTPRFAEHHRRIYILVITLYLLYNIYEADWDLLRAGDFYSDLGLPPTASDREIKTHFRKLAAQHHPDKVQALPGLETGAHFIHLKQASETLLDPVKRFAYERFGPDVLRWQHCKTYRDYVNVGVGAMAPYYVGIAIALYGLPFLGVLSSSGQYWRWMVLAAVLVFELQVVTRPTFPALLTGMVNPRLVRFTTHPPYLPFQAVTLARKLSMVLSIAVIRVGPYLTADTSGGIVDLKADDDDAQLNQNLQKAETLCQLVGADAQRMLDMEVLPYVAQPAGLQNLSTKIRDWLVQNTIDKDPAIRDAINVCVARIARQRETQT